MTDHFVYTGPAGTVFTNRTARVHWQFAADLDRVCGDCLELHTWVRSQPWPIPTHRGCRCRSVPIGPGEDAPSPFVNRRQLIEGWPYDRQAVAVGRPNLSLLRAGLASWDDLVTEDRVRELWEVVRRRGLTLTQLRAAGVPRFQAQRAVARVQKAEETGLTDEAASELHRWELLGRLTPLDQATDAIVASLGAVTGQRVAAAPVAVPSHAEELARLLAEWRPSPRRQRDAAQSTRSAGDINRDHPSG
jgi:hypothetical protein